MEQVLEITRLAMEVNQLGKHQVFVNISPHVSSVDVTFYEGGWKQGKAETYRNHFYYDNFIGYLKDNYEEIKSKLIELKEKDLLGTAIPSRSIENNI